MKNNNMLILAFVFALLIPSASHTAEKDISIGARGSKLWSSNIAVPVSKEKFELLSNETYLDLLQNGIDLLLLGKYKDAVTNFEKTLRIDPRQPEVYYNMGIAYFQMGKYSNAIVQYRRAIDLKNNFAEARNNLGVCYIKEKLLDTGIDQIRLANIYAPTMSQPLENLDEVKNKNTEYNYNNKIFRTKNELKESSPSRIFSLNLKLCPPLLSITEETIARNEMAMSDKKNREKAEKLSHEGLTESDRDILKKYPEVFFETRGDLELFNKENKYWDALNLLKVADDLFERELYNESIAYYTRVLNIASNSYSVYFKRGLARFKAKNYTGAESDFKNVVRNSDDDSLINSGLEQLKQLREKTFSKF